jgi:hypothetical protein
MIEQEPTKFEKFIAYTIAAAIVIWIAAVIRLIVIN